MSDLIRPRPARVAALILLVAAAAAAAFFLFLREEDEGERLAACPAGYHRPEPRAESAAQGLVGEAGAVASAQPSRDEGEEAEGEERPCVLRQPETPGELLTVAHGIAARAGLDAPGT